MLGSWVADKNASPALTRCVPCRLGLCSLVGIGPTMKTDGERVHPPACRNLIRSRTAAPPLMVLSCVPSKLNSLAYCVELRLLLEGGPVIRYPTATDVAQEAR
jgi:hypothetical protein